MTLALLLLGAGVVLLSSLRIVYVLGVIAVNLVRLPFAVAQIVATRF